MSDAVSPGVSGARTRASRSPSSADHRALFELCRAGDAAGLKQLVEARPDLLETFGAACDGDGRSAFYVACMEGRADVVAYLLSTPLAAEHLTAANRNGCTPCYVAARRGHAAVVDLLAKRAVSLSTPTDDGDTPAWIACYQGHVGVARLLRRHGCSLEHANRNGATPLYAAAQQDQADVVAFLLESGVAVDAAMADGWGPAHIAAMNGHARVVALLVAHGADVHREARDGSTPANLAAAERHDAVVALCAGAAPPAARGVDYADI